MLQKFYLSLIVSHKKVSLKLNKRVYVILLFAAPPAGVFLEAPFKNISQASAEYIISPLFYNNQWIVKMGDEAMEKLNIRFDNAEKLEITF